MEDEELIIYVQQHECLYNMQHKHYDNVLVKENVWRQIAGKLSSKGKKKKDFQMLDLFSV